MARAGKKQAQSPRQESRDGDGKNIRASAKESIDSNDASPGKQSCGSPTTSERSLGLLGAPPQAEKMMFVQPVFPTGKGAEALAVWVPPSVKRTWQLEQLLRQGRGDGGSVLGRLGVTAGVLCQPSPDEHSHLLKGGVVSRSLERLSDGKLGPLASLDHVWSSDAPVLLYMMQAPPGSKRPLEDAGQGSSTVKQPRVDGTVKIWYKLVLGGDRDYQAESVTVDADMDLSMLKVRLACENDIPKRDVVLCAPTGAEIALMQKDPPHNKLPARLEGNTEAGILRPDLSLGDLPEVQVGDTRVRIGTKAWCPVLVVHTGSAPLVTAPRPSRWWMKYGHRRDHNPWEESPEATAYLKALIDTAVTKVPFQREVGDGETVAEEAEVYELGRDQVLFDDEKVSPALVLPPHTIGLWQCVYQYLESESRSGWSGKALVIGTPGVGKSRSLSYALRLIIMEGLKKDRETRPIVVYEHRKAKMVYLFAPKEKGAGEYEGFMVMKDDFREAGCACLESPSNYYIVDTAKAEDGTTDPADRGAQVIYSASPDPVHYTEFQKSRCETFYCPWWPPEAIVACRGYLSRDRDELTEAVALERLGVVGPIPRRISCAGIYEAFRTKVEDLGKDEATSATILNTMKTSNVDDSRNSKEKPYSAAFALGVGLTVDGQPDFKARTVHLVSDYARSKLNGGVLKQAYLNVITNSKPELQTEKGKLFEHVVFRMMLLGWSDGLMIPISFDKNGRGSLTNSRRTLVVKERECGVEVFTGNGSHARVYNKVKGMDLLDRSGNGISPVCIGGNFPVVDAMDARNRGYQLTVGRSKVICWSKVQDLRDKLGLSESNVFHLVFLVPHGNELDIRLEEGYDGKKLRVYLAQAPNPGGKDFEQVFQGSQTGS